MQLPVHDGEHACCNEYRFAASNREYDKEVSMSLRPVQQILNTIPTMEGAGVKLQRAFGFGKTKEFDPFLLFDDFRSDTPADYLAGFPWHPHRGIETITYVLAGEVVHGDSLGNHGRMTAGDVQWMTAGSGILHQEMPKGDDRGRMHGFQLWANLPASLKMTNPRYQDIPASAIPLSTDDDGTVARVICGEFRGRRGPVEGVAADPHYIDISIPPNRLKHIEVETTRNAFAYVFAGSGSFRDASTPRAVLTESATNPSIQATYEARNHSLVLFDRGDEIVVRSGPEGIRFLLVSGKPIEEPVAWRGPIVMNSEAELNQAWTELRNGTFISRK
jgi:redox-sensitive bicupin YhaK (pirin superfamily)